MVGASPQGNCWSGRPTSRSGSSHHGVVPSPQLSREQVADAGASLRKLLDAVETGELTAPPYLVARLEGALIALAAVATGRTPSPDDFIRQTEV